MGLLRLILKSNPIYLGREIIISSKEEGNVSKGVRKVFKETMVEDIPGFGSLYEMGKLDGKKQGYVEASDKYEEKFRKQAELFMEQKGLFESQIEEYERIMDEYEIRIIECEMRYGTEVDKMSFEQKEKLLNLLIDQRKLRQIKNVKIEKKSDEIDIKLLREYIVDNRKQNMYGYRSYKEISDIVSINEKMIKNEDECVFYYDPSFVGNVMKSGQGKHGIIFGVNGVLFIDESNKYVKYEQIQYCNISFVPAGLIVNRSNESNVFVKGISYAQEDLIKLVEYMCFNHSNGYQEIIYKNKNRRIRKVLLESIKSAWKMSQYPGKLIEEEHIINKWYDEYAVISGISNMVKSYEIIAKYRENYFNLIFGEKGFLIENEKKYIYILYKNIKTYEKLEDRFSICLIEGSLIEFDKINLDFLNLVFKRIREFEKSREYYSKEKN